MAQTTNTSYAARDADPTKAVDYALQISGWPTIYTVNRGDYSMPSTGLLSTASGFTAIRQWANAPKGSNTKIKKRPEEGGMTIGEVTMEVQDRYESGVRAISDLISRQAYVEGVSAGYATNLTLAIDREETTVTVASTTNFASAGVIYIAHEAIAYTGVTATTFTGCTRGHLGSLASPHQGPLSNSSNVGVKVYSFLPQVVHRPAWIYKGYQGIPLDKWVKAFGGVITSEAKDGTLVEFTINAANYRTHGKTHSIATGKVFDGSVVTLPNPKLPADFSNITINVNSIATTASIKAGRYLIDFGPEFWALSGVTFG